MTRFSSSMLGVLLAGVAAGSASAAEIIVKDDITVSTVWTADNTYNLQKQIYVRAGATLTIQAGTKVISDTNVGGSLAVVRGAQIFVQGTARNPVIMTSKADAATWTGGDPRTGTWREAANEWGNLTMMGFGYISEDAVKSNTKNPNPNNVAQMEGLVERFPGDPSVLYGGGNDDDDSGSISYLSLRYGGKVIALTNELNGLSLGGIGRGTDMHHIEIMNNVDDGVEIWGGTVELKYVSIWNIGDDSFDIDQGWRGKAQYVLIVQGYSLDASQGSGVGDNGFETDGAENSDYQPQTRGVIYNATFIGQPTDGDRATAWRDNAGMQYRQCIFMDGGEEVVGFDDKDGDGAQGYGYNGTSSWAQKWQLPYNTYEPINQPSNPAAFYPAQTSGMICEISDSVFYGNKSSKAYTEADARGVFDAKNNNVKEPSTSPIGSIQRAAAVVKGGKVMQQVTKLDPTPRGAALASVNLPPVDGFFDQTRFRGAFRPGSNWLVGWSAADAFGFLQANGPHSDLGEGLRGVNGEPTLEAMGPFTPNSQLTVEIKNGPASAPAVLLFGVDPLRVPVFGGTLLVNFVPVNGLLPILVTNGTSKLTLPVPGFPKGETFYWQAWIIDPAGPQSLSATNGIMTITP